MQECVFCKIVRKEIPAGMVAEEEQAVAFMDIMPARKGHVLVLPKRHSETMTAVPAEDLIAAMGLVQRVCRALQDAIKPPGFSVVQLNGEASGQTVFHIHFHVIPRQAGDGLAMKWGHESYRPGEMQQYQDKIVHSLRTLSKRS